MAALKDSLQASLRRSSVTIAVVLPEDAAHAGRRQSRVMRGPRWSLRAIALRGSCWVRLNAFSVIPVAPVRRVAVTYGGDHHDRDVSTLSPPRWLPMPPGPRRRGPSARSRC